MRKHVFAFVAVALLASVAQAAPIMLIDDGIKTANASLYQAAQWTAATIGGEACMQVSFGATTNVYASVVPSAGLLLGDNTKFSITFCVVSQDGTQGVSKINTKFTPPGGSNANYNTTVAWYPTANEWTTYEVDLAAVHGAAADWTVTRAYLYDGTASATTVLYVKDMGFVPEPASMSVLALGALAMLRRRR